MTIMEQKTRVSDGIRRRISEVNLEEPISAPAEDIDSLSSPNSPIILTVVLIIAVAP